FLGPNGAGKSTTVRMLVTLLPPTGGRATVGGLDVVRDGPKVRRIIGVALQEAAPDPLLTAREPMVLPAGLERVSPPGGEQRAPAAGMRRSAPTSSSSVSRSRARPTGRSGATPAG